jgi:hypothetical protein
MLAVALGALAAIAPAGHAQEPVFPISLAVATEEGTPVVDDAWIDLELGAANTIFAPSDVSFVVRERRALDARFTHLETRADRHALGEALQPGVINVFVVGSLRDVDDPSLMRRGVHWRPAGIPGAHFVIVSSISGPDVLAHELGHFFGNPHSDTPNDVMSYQRDGTVPAFFEAHELARIRRSARRFVTRGEIVP